MVVETINLIISLIAIILAIVGTGIAFVVIRIIDERLKSIETIIARGTEEHKKFKEEHREFRAENRKINERLDDLYKHLLEKNEVTCKGT